VTTSSVSSSPLQFPLGLLDHDDEVSIISLYVCNYEARPESKVTSRVGR